VHTMQKLILLLLAVCVSLAQGTATYAQTARRSFQMALWPDTSPSVVPTLSDADVKTFWEIYGQPAAPARSIAFIQSWQKNTPLPAYDWSRILAVEIDEPYATNLIGHFDLSQNPCHSPDAMKVVNATMNTLAIEANMVRASSPQTRFWVNFSATEVEWMMDPGCSPALALNQPNIDVISVDHYRTPFYRTALNPNVQAYYDWFIAHPATPQQQLALVPGTFFVPGTDDPATQASYLQGYFDYANSMNSNCNLSLGTRGSTFNFDGCRVWIVMGWLAGNYDVYVGLLDPRSAVIANTWRKEARPTRAQILQDVILPVLQGD
jgi:hypothetical protein